MTDEKRTNPYLALCLCCHATVCMACIRYDERANGEFDGCEECNAYVRRNARNRRAHLAVYDHRNVQA